MPTADDAATQAQLRALAERYAQGVDRRDASTPSSRCSMRRRGHHDPNDPSETEEPRRIRWRGAAGEGPGGDQAIP